MKKTTIIPHSSLMVQVPAGIKVNCIQDEDGTLYFPVMQVEGGTASVKAAPDAVPAKAPAKNSPDVSKDTAPAHKNLTEEEMMDMETAELKTICTDNKIKYPAEGKDTNKKFRTAILEWQKKNPGKAAPANEEDEGEEDGEEISAEAILGWLKEGKEDAEIVAELLAYFEEDEHKAAKKKINAIFAELEEEEKTQKQAAKALFELLPEDEDEDDAKAEDEAPAKKGAKAPAAKKKKGDPDGTELDVTLLSEELEKGDKVSVWWESLSEWNEGAVSKIRGEDVFILYDDGETEVIDTDDHTRVFKLEE